jgi:phage terminase large subunit
MTVAEAFVWFEDRYAFEPVLFVREVFDEEPDPEQAAIMMDVARGERRIAVRSGHGVGKTTVLAWLLCWFACTRFPQRCVCTAPTSGQLFDALAAETKSWFRKLPPLLLERFELQSERINLIAKPEDSYIAFKTSRAETPEALAGIHSDNVLLVADEASGVPEQVFEAASGSMSGHRATMLMTGNPVRSTGLFFEAFHTQMHRWKTYHISCLTCPRVTPDFIEEMKDRYGEESNAYRVRVLGEFPKGDDDTVIPMELVEAALTRDVHPAHVKPIWGLDCARFGSDRSALAKRKGNVLLEPVVVWSGLDMMQLAGTVKAIYDATPKRDSPSEICVDSIGIGAGVADRLRELGLPVRDINVSESPSIKGVYLNQRAELWFEMRSWFETRAVSIAGDRKLLSELVGVRYKFHSSGKKAVESKEELRKRSKERRSPDIADAVMMTFAGTAISALHGSANSFSWNQPLPYRAPNLV